MGEGKWTRANGQGWMSDGELAKVIGQGQMGTANEQGTLTKAH